MSQGRKGSQARRKGSRCPAVLFERPVPALCLLLPTLPDISHLSKSPRYLMLSPGQPSLEVAAPSPPHLVAPWQARECQAGPEPSAIPGPVTGGWLQAQLLLHLPKQCCMCRTAPPYWFPPPTGHLSHHQPPCLHVTWAHAPGQPGGLPAP